MEPRLAALGWDSAWAAVRATVTTDHLEPARVAVQHRGAYVLYTADGETAAAVSPPAVYRTYAPRCCTATRAGSRWSVVAVARTASHAASQPSAASRGSIAPPSSRRGPSGHDAEGRKVRRRQDRRCGTWRSQAPSFEAPPSIRRASGAQARNDSIRVE